MEYVSYSVKENTHSGGFFMLKTAHYIFAFFLHRCWRYNPLHGARAVQERSRPTAQPGQHGAAPPQEGQLPQLPLPTAGVQIL